MEDVPFDALKQILSYLTNDGLSVGRLSLCSSRLYDSISHNVPEIWEYLLNGRWTSKQGLIKCKDYRMEFIRRHEIDRDAISALQSMNVSLRKTLKLAENDIFLDGSPTAPHVGKVWEHPSWKTLLAHRSDVIDILKLKARQYLSSSSSSVSTPISEKLFSFLAARSYQNIHFVECLYEWKNIHDLQERNEVTDAEENDMNGVLLERYALMVCELQQSLPELLDGKNSHTSITQVILNSFESIAACCRQKIEESNAKTVSERIFIVRDVLVQKYGFVGNSENYYDYRNSLLHHVLESKKGIPITLCIIYVCICRRLDLPAYLTGLPGHVVLSFKDDERVGGVGFLDVFRDGRLLSLEDCIRICFSYGVPWDDEFWNPLPARHVLHRILNNLTNCHSQAMANNVPFQSDLFFQQRTLAAIHCQPPIANMLLERIAQDLPLTLSRDLLRYYGLLSPSSTT